MRKYYTHDNTENITKIEKFSINSNTLLSKKESKNRDSLNGYTYFKFLNAGLNIGFTKENKN